MLRYYNINRYHKEKSATDIYLAKQASGNFKTAS